MKTKDIHFLNAWVYAMFLEESIKLLYAFRQCEHRQRNIGFMFYIELYSQSVKFNISTLRKLSEF